MQKQNILKQWKMIFQASLVFYLGVSIFGLLPMVLFDGELWSDNFFLVVLGLIIGVVIFIGLIVMLMTIVLSASPKIRTFDYLYILIVVLSLGILDVGFAEDNMLSTETATITFLIVAGTVIILQLIARAMISNTSETTLQNLWQKGIESLPKIAQTNKAQITKIIMSVFVVIVFVVLNDVEDRSDTVATFLVIFALGFYVIKLYHESYLLSQKQKVFNIISFVLLHIGIVVLLLIFPDFFGTHKVIKGFVTLLPFAPFLYVIIPHFYIIYWHEKDQSFSQE